MDLQEHTPACISMGIKHDPEKIPVWSFAKTKKDSHHEVCSLQVLDTGEFLREPEDACGCLVSCIFQELVVFGRGGDHVARQDNMLDLEVR